MTPTRRSTVARRLPLRAAALIAAAQAVVVGDDGRHDFAGLDADETDPTGAGDSFNGAYLAARVQGKAPDEAARAAHRVAGIVIGHKGALVDPALVKA